MRDFYFPQGLSGELLCRLYTKSIIQTSRNRKALINMHYLSMCKVDEEYLNKKTHNTRSAHTENCILPRKEIAL